MIIKNPFEHFFPDNLTPEEIHRLFVKEYTEHNSLTAYKHTIVEGSRGSGKSMLLKYLEPECQIIDFNGWEQFLSKTKAFIGIYINCNTGDYRKREFEELLAGGRDTKIVSEKIIIHDFIMRIAEWVIRTISEQLKKEIKEDPQIIDKIIITLDKKGIYADKSIYPRTICGLRNVFSNERILLSTAVEDYFEYYAKPNNYLSYSGNYVDASFQEGSFLFVLLNSFRLLLGSPMIPFFLLFDEAGEQMLLPIQQKIINSLISQRIHNLVCIKVSVRPETYNIDVDLTGKPIQQVHDYDSLNLDSLYTNNNAAYYQRILEISNKRLTMACFEVTDIRKLIPEREFEIEKMREAINYTDQEYNSLPEKQIIEEKQNYINKYARARMFQKLFDKTSYWYTGFNNLVHFSAGITRSFLDPCFIMLEKYMQRNPETIITSIQQIPPEIQWDTIRDFSNDFIDKELVARIRRRDVISNERIMLQKLFNLIESLGGIFKIRLQNTQSRYPRIISFSIKGIIAKNKELEEVLKRALQECFLQRRWYRGKSGYEMLECYILNRRLCPRYGLDLSGFQGRIELSQEHVSLAMGDTQKFIGWFKNHEKTGEADEMTQLDLFGT